MARTQTVQEMVSNLRAEAGHSLSVAQGTNTEATLKYILKRTQEELWAAFVWPELMIRDDRPMTPGVRTYDYSTSLKFDAIRQAFSARPNSGAWTEVGYGIGEDQLDAGTLDNSTRSDPVQFWEANGDKFNVWPTPVASGNVLRFKGNRELQPFQSNSDRSTLDATAIVLFAASELLARSKAEDAANKLQKAQRHLTKLLGNQVSAKNKLSTFGTGPAMPSRRQGNTVIIGYP